MVFQIDKQVRIRIKRIFPRDYQTLDTKDLSENNRVVVLDLVAQILHCVALYCGVLGHWLCIVLYYVVLCLDTVAQVLVCSALCRLEVCVFF